ncbi:XrtA/PEP-CTERM system histidine kinase PrsK [Humitalea sp. 24SJ18S-53]|uniref:XrtA/PEP-CTERM system histidine kinase PrsK n=1 Tax=Humitalea sp. 24SJ18S-53 TaxID=3422307 RepID=UPI003D666623
MTFVTSTFLHAGCAAICATWAVLVLCAGRSRTALLLAATLAITAVWAGAVAFAPDAPLDGVAGLLEVTRSAAWFAALLVLYRRVAGAANAPLVRRFAWAGIAVTALALANIQPGMEAALTLPTLGSPVVLARLGIGLLVVLLAENLYRVAPEAARWHIILPCIALGGLAAFDLLLYADAALSGAFSPGMIDARAIVTAVAAPLLAIAAVRDRRSRRDPPVSRQLVFHGTTLMVAGTFLLGVGAVGEALRHLDDPWAQALQIGLAAGAVMALAVAGTARSARSWLRRLLVDHFFIARYDYRREWLRCVATLSDHGSDTPADVRAIRAIADAADSPAGLLLMRDPDGTALRWAGAWNGPTDMMELAEDHAMVAALHAGEWVAQPGPGELADLRASFPELWIIVPLTHHRDGLLGAVLLARPRAPFVLDGEVFALLRTLGREVAMFLAERRNAERLTDQERLAAYARRFAFVAHDVKTLAAQLRMLSANAAAHIADPDFQRDMLITLGAASERIDTLISRLRGPEDRAADAPTIEPLARLRSLAAGRHPAVAVEDDGQPPCLIPMAPDAFDAAVTHLLDNAMEASAPGEQVNVCLRHDGPKVVVDIRDGGKGMTADFIRDALFRPLATTRPDGNGIGAWQARALLRAAGGEVTAVSAPGRGTTMRLTLPAIRPRDDVGRRAVGAEP